MNTSEFDTMTLPQVLVAYQLAVKGNNKEACDYIEKMLAKNYEEKPDKQECRVSDGIRNSHLKKSEQEEIIKIKRVIAYVRGDIDVVKIQSIEELRKVFEESLKDASKKYLNI